MKYQNLPIATFYRRFRALAQKLRKMMADGSFNTITKEKQFELLQKAKHLFQQLKHTIAPAKLKKVLASGALVAALGLGTLNAQTFGEPQLDPFNLNGSPEENFGYYFPQLVDIDADGDYDIMAIGSLETDGYYANTRFFFFENTGTAQVPNFVAPVENPFGITSVTYMTTLSYGDLDGDGDFDLVVGRYEDEGEEISLLYFENTGSIDAPAFGTGVINPFNTQTGNDIVVPFLVDFDGDGDLDLLGTDYDYDNIGTGRYLYQENIGTPTTPNFASTIASPFGLESIEDAVTIIPFVGDIDNDGDLDVLSGGNYYFDIGGDNERTYLNFIENTGTAENPDFAAPQAEPFDIVFPEPSYAVIPTMADLDDDGDLDVLTVSYLYETETRPNANYFVYFENETTTNVDAISKTGPELNVFPTITSDVVNWQLQDYGAGTPLQVSLYSLTGQLLKREKTNNRYGTIHMETYTSGMYIVQIHATDGQRIAEQKIVRQ